jgi:hypothetical protein
LTVHHIRWKVERVIRNLEIFFEPSESGIVSLPSFVCDESIESS